MLKKYQNVSDEELINFFKSGAYDAEFELGERYKIKSTKLAYQIYTQFKYKITCDVDDLYNCALFAVFKAADSFKSGKFEVYWKIIAKNDLMDMIKRSSDSYLSKGTVITVQLEDSLLDIYNGEFNDDSLTSDLLYEEMIRLIEKVAPKKDNSKEIFFLFMQGYSIKEIAKEMKMNEGTVRYKIDRVKTKLEQLLIHS